MSKLTVIDEIKGGDHELNYFVFETHVRKMIRDLMEPFGMKATDDRELVNETRRQLILLSKRLHELEFIIYKGNERNTIFDDIYDRINKQNVEFTLQEEKLKEEVFKLLKRHEIEDTRLDAIENTQKTINEKSRAFQTDVDKLYESLSQTKREMGQTIVDNKQKADAEASALNQSIIKIQATLSLYIHTMIWNLNILCTLKINQREFDGASNRIQQLEKERDKHQEILHNLSRDLFTTQEIKLDRTEFTMDTKKIEEQFLQIDYSLGDLNNRLKSTDNYAEKYVPFRALQVLIEGLGNVLDKRQIKKLQEFEEKKYQQFHDNLQILKMFNCYEACIEFIVLKDDGNPRGEKISTLNLRSPTRKDTLNLQTQITDSEFSELLKSPATGKVVKSQNTQMLLEKHPELHKNQASLKLIQQIQSESEKIAEIVSEMKGAPNMPSITEKHHTTHNLQIHTRQQIGAHSQGQSINQLKFLQSASPNDQARSLFSLEKAKSRAESRQGMAQIILSNLNDQSIMSEELDGNQIRSISVNTQQKSSFQQASGFHGAGGLVSFQDIDPTFQNKIRGFEEEIDTLKTETEGLRRMMNAIKGLDRDEIYKEFKRVREEIKLAGKEILTYCQALQDEMDKEKDQRKRDKIQIQVHHKKLLNFD